MIETAPTLTESFVECGYLHVPHSINPYVLSRVRERIRPYEAGLTVAQADSLSYGYDLDLSEYLDIISHGAKLLRSLGARPEIANAVLVPKFPGEGRRNWHKDSSEASINGTLPGNPPREVMMLYYLQDTNAQNGCFLALPRADGSEAKGNQPLPGEMPVTVELGDVILFDPRLSHAALPNRTDDIRMMIRLRFHCEWPNYRGTNVH